MSLSIKEKLIERIQQLLNKGEQVKSTHKPNPPGVIGFPTLDDQAYYGWRSSVENLIIRVAGKDSSYYRNFESQVEDGYKGSVNTGIGILRALKEDLELGYLSDIRDLVFAEVFSDFLQIARHLLDHNYKDPAASLSGAVLEDGLKKLANKFEIRVKDRDDIGSVNTKLADAEVYNRLVQKQIQTWKAIRDSADHGKFDDYKAADVSSMIDGVSRFLMERL